MPPTRKDYVERQVLLSAVDRENADALVRRGIASNVSQAIRLGLAVAVATLVTATTPAL